MVGPDRAEDVVQDALVKAYQSFQSLRDPAAAAGWLRAILVNTATDAIRRDERNKETPAEDVESYSLFRVIAEEDPFPYSDSLHLDFLSCFTEADVWAVLDDLPAIYRLPLALVHMEGLSTRHAARLLGVPLGTVLSQLHRGRKLFERRMWEYAEENDLLKRKEGAMS